MVFKQLNVQNSQEELGEIMLQRHPAALSHSKPVFKLAHIYIH